MGEASEPVIRIFGILDVTGEEEVLGKPVGSDAKNGKTTFATLLGPEEAGRQVEALTASAVRTLGELPGDGSFLTALLTYMAERKF